MGGKGISQQGGRREAVLWQVDLTSRTGGCWQPRGGFGEREAPLGDGLVRPSAAEVVKGAQSIYQDHCHGFCVHVRVYLRVRVMRYVHIGG